VDAGGGVIATRAESPLPVAAGLGQWLRFPGAVSPLVVPTGPATQTAPLHLGFAARDWSHATNDGNRGLPRLESNTNYVRPPPRSRGEGKPVSYKAFILRPRALRNGLCHLPRPSALGIPHSTLVCRALKPKLHSGHQPTWHGGVRVPLGMSNWGNSLPSHYLTLIAGQGTL
jgi:hypothetical protein